jgi:hypothetical protein
VATRPEDAASRRQGGRNDWQRLSGSLPRPPDDPDAHDLLWREFEAQFSWYDRAATRNRVSYQSLKVLAIVFGSVVTVLAAVGASPGITASLAAAVVVLEGVQQVFQFHANWISYRAAAETLRQHAFMYAAGFEPYDNADTRRPLLATAMRDIASRETSGWSSHMLQSTARQVAAPD